MGYRVTEAGRDVLIDALTEDVERLRGELARAEALLREVHVGDMCQIEPGLRGRVAAFLGAEEGR